MPTPQPRGPRLPDDGALDRLVARLASVRSSVGVIRLVERWAQSRPPTRLALLAEARAFVDLGLMDRAWVRLRELTDADESDLEAMALTAEMFIARGWPARAGRLVDRLQAHGLDSARLRDIQEGASAPPIRPPSNARELERGGSVEQQISLAETFLATGSVLRARGVLERLSRTQGAHPRVQQLLWGLRGEFASSQQDLSALVTELQTGLTSDGGWDASEPTASLEHADPETAEASKVMRAWQPDSGDRRAAFSGLFRMGASDDGGDEEIEDDVTVAAVMASNEEMADPPTWEHSDPDGVIASSSGDTQIMQVIGSGENRRLAPVAGQVHNARPERKGPVDLRRWRAEHGVVPPTNLLDSPTMDALGAFDDEDFLEEEDEDVVVMTRQEEPTQGPRAPVQRRSPISVIERVPVPPPPIPNLPGQDEATPTVGPAPAAHEPDPPERSPEPEPEPPPLLLQDTASDAATVAEASRSRSSLVRLLAVTGALVMVVMVLAGVMGMRAMVGATQSLQVRQAVLDSHPSELLELRDVLRAQVQGDGLLSPTRSHAAARLVLVDLALWEVVSGDPDVLAEARSLAQEGLGGPEAQLAIAWLDKVAGTPISLDAAPDDPLVALLQAEEAIESGRWTDAQGALDGISVSSGVRVALADIQIRDQQGTVSVEAVPASVRTHPLGMIWLYAGGDPNLSEGQRLGSLAALREVLPAEAARLRAQTHVVEAELQGAAGRTEAASAAWEAALAEDPNDPRVLAQVAAQRRTSGGALQLLRRCLQILASAPPCQRGIVQVHVEEGNLPRAVALVDSWREAGLGVGLLADWVSLQGGATDVRPGAPEPSDPDRAGRGLSRYLDALGQGSRGARQSGLGAAVQELEASGNPWDRRLAAFIEREQATLIAASEQ